MFKYVLVPATGTEADQAVFQTAFAAASPFAAHLAFLHVRMDVTEVVVAMSLGGLGGGDAMQSIVDRLEAEARELEAKAWHAVGEFCDQHAIRRSTTPIPDVVTASCDAETGSEGQWVAEYGRFADLVVIGASRQGRDGGAELLEAALMETGRPLLIAPPAPAERLTGTVVIAWKDTPEAARAVAAAIPLIERADRVVIVSIAEADAPAEQSCERLLRKLLWHNPATELQRVVQAGARPVEVLLAAAHDHHASLLVMGGYSHSRLREVVFGGFTRHVLSGIDLPVLMAH